MLSLSKTKLNHLMSHVNLYFQDWEHEAFAEPSRRAIKELFELTMRDQVRGQLKVDRHERSSLRCDWRNGYYHRNLVTSMGLVPDLRVPRLRTGVFKTTLFRRYQRRWRQVDRWIQGIFINGVSTREVSGVVRDLLGAQISASTVSAINKELDREVGLFHRRPIKDEYVYLFLDGIVKKVISCGRRVKKIILVAYGIRRDGVREVIDYRVALGESEREWYVFLHGLYQRGFKGALLRLIITDGGIGLRSALDMVYPLVERQRCWVHKLRNVASYLPRRYQKDCLRGARRIYQAKSQTEAIRHFQTWQRTWQQQAPKAVHCLAKDIEELLTFFSQKDNLWIKLRTTNAIERLFRELRKRTRPMCLFTNIPSCDRILYALFNKYNKQWKERRYAVAN
jgi:transposase-like protein